MISVELFKKIQRFHFSTRRMANNLYAGQYESAFRGRGMEFAEGLHGCRFGQPGKALQQDMSITQKADQKPFNKTSLAYNHLLHFSDDLSKHHALLFNLFRDFTDIPAHVFFLPEID